MPEAPEVRASVIVNSATLRDGIQKWRAALNTVVREAGRAFANVHRTMGPLMHGPNGTPIARCRTCRPWANPRPLTIDGAAYARRRRGRRQ